MINKKIGFIGAGKMGTALILGFLNNKLVKKNNVSISDKDRKRISYFKSMGIRNFETVELARRSDIIFIAVKPNQVKEVCTRIGPEIKAKIIIMSIAAGVCIKNIEDFLGMPRARIVRIMPNTPALVKKGMMAYCFSKGFENTDLSMIKSLLSSVGEPLFLDEKHFDAVTGLSGSGPAYVFLMIDALAEGGIKKGLPRKAALKLAAQTVLGAGELVIRTGKDPQDLIDMVSSPGGTTIEGLRVLKEKKVKQAFIKAVAAAADKSKKLIKGDK